DPGHVAPPRRPTDDRAPPRAARDGDGARAPGAARTGRRRRRAHRSCRQRRRLAGAGRRGATGGGGREPAEQRHQGLFGRRHRPPALVGRGVMTGRAVLSLLAALVVGGCTTGWRGPAAGESRAARSAMTDADAAAMNGNVRDANARYELIVKQYPKDPIAAE